MVDFDWAGLDFDWTRQDRTGLGWAGPDWIGLDRDSNESGLDQVRASSVLLSSGGVDRMRNGDGDGERWELGTPPGSAWAHEAGERVDKALQMGIITGLDGGGERERDVRDDAAEKRGRQRDRPDRQTNGQTTTTCRYSPVQSDSCSL